MKKQFYYFIVVVLFIASCGTSKLEKGELLYTGAEINITSDSLSKKEIKRLKENLQENLTPKPNTSILGIRPKLFFYNLIGETKKKKGLKYWLKKQKLAEKPVLTRDVDKEFNRDIIVNYAENNGFFNAKASYETKKKNKLGKVVYNIKLGQQYTIRTIHFELDSAALGKEFSKVKNNTFLKQGATFNLDVIKAERQRIDARLKERGFYYFHPDNIILEADSTVTQKAEIDLKVKLKEDTPKLAKKQFSINKVVVFADYNINDLTKKGYEIPYNTDSLKITNGIFIVDPDCKFKPHIFNRAMSFRQGELYSRREHNMALNRLGSLGVFKFVKNEFLISDSTTNKFDAYYILTPNETQSLRLETTAKSNSADYVGGEVNLNWAHRNIFRGAEQLRLSAYGAVDVQMGGKRDANNIYRFGTNTQLSIPKLIVPFSTNISSAFIPRTNANIGYEFISRSALYSLHNFNTALSYIWKENARQEHELKVLDATLIYSQNVTAKYEEEMKDSPMLRRVVENQLVFGSTYKFTYTTTMLPRRNTMYYQGMIDLSGNITGLLLGADKKGGKQKEVFKIPFSQYAKMQHDFRFYHNFSTKNSVATRLIAGIAYPYGNSEYIPFSRQFFSGGANSIRAFQARTLGPGSYNPETQDASFFYEQGGDVRLELNLEYRTRLWKFLNAAAFIDAGNIWLVNKDTERPGGKFSKNWYKEIAVGAGVGLRFDFSILVLRLDLATPIRIPYYERVDRWRVDRIDFGDSQWIRDNLILNIAIGYPF